MYYVAKDGADAFETYRRVAGAGLLEETWVGRLL
jgi:hypothetical protein